MCPAFPLRWQSLAVPAHTRQDRAEGQTELNLHLPFFMPRCCASYIHPLRTRTIERITHTIAVPPQMMPKPCGTFASGIQLRSTFMP